MDFAGRCWQAITLLCKVRSAGTTVSLVGWWLIDLSTVHPHSVDVSVSPLAVSRPSHLFLVVLPRVCKANSTSPTH